MKVTLKNILIGLAKRPIPVLPGGVWSRSEQSHDGLDNSQSHDSTAEVRVWAGTLRKKHKPSVTLEDMIIANLFTPTPLSLHSRAGTAFNESHALDTQVCSVARWRIDSLQVLYYNSERTTPIGDTEPRPSPCTYQCTYTYLSYANLPTSRFVEGETWVPGENTHTSAQAVTWA